MYIIWYKYRIHISIYYITIAFKTDHGMQLGNNKLIKGGMQWGSIIFDDRGINFLHIYIHIIFTCHRCN